MARRTITIASFIISSLLVIGCSRDNEKRAPDSNSKIAALEFLKILPSADSFEFSNASIMFSDEDLRPYAVPSTQDWQRSDMAEVLGRIGGRLEDVLQAHSVVEVSTRRLKSNAVIIQLSDEVIRRLKNDVDKTNFDIRNLANIEVFTTRVPLAKALGKMSYALIADKLISGDLETVDEIVRAFSGSYTGPITYDNEKIKSIWEQLPDGFSMTVAVGNEHSYVWSLPAISYGESTMKINKKYAEEVFIANFSTAEEASSAIKKIENNIRSFGNTTQRDISVRNARLSKNMVIVRIRIALSDVTF